MNQPNAQEEQLLDREMTELLGFLWRDQPLEAETERVARELLLDTLGAALSGLQAPVIGELVAALSAAEPGQIPFPGTSHRLSAAMFMNAYSAAVCHFEAGEGLPVSHGRPGLHAIGALLPHWLSGNYALSEILAALVAGYEVGGRLGALLRIRPGMHVDGTWGSFAAAAAVARLQRLTPGQALEALNHVACQVPYSLYYPITKGSIARNFFIGHGAILGNNAVLAARTGFGGPAGSMAQYARLALGIENARLPAAFPPEVRILHQGYLKPYPCTRHMHYGIEAASRWVARNGPLAAPAERIHLRVYAEAMQYCPNRRPQQHIQAQFSLTYGLAYALMHGTFDPNAYRPETIGDPVLGAIEDSIEVSEHAELTAAGKRGCTLEIVHDGQRDVIEIDSIAGDTGKAMSTDEVVDKFVGLAGPVLGAEAAGRIAQSILHDPADQVRALSLPMWGG